MLNKTSGIDPILIKKAYAKYDKMKKNKKKALWLGLRRKKNNLK